MEVLQDNDSFFVGRDLWQGKPAIIKRLQPTTSQSRRAGFRNEIAGMQRFGTFAHEHPEWGIKVPKVYAVSEDEIVREYMQGQELVTEKTLDVDSAKLRLGKLARTLAAIDMLIPGTDDDVVGENSAPYTNIRQRFEIWSKGPLEAGLLSEEGYAAANELIEEYQPYLTPRYAHGDMSPFDHVFLTPDNSIGLIDFEHYSSQKPRFYDLCYTYTRLFTRAQDPALAGYFLGEFIAVSKSMDERQLLAVMTQRAVGMHIDALNDYKQGKDYRKRAQKVLQLCLRRDIDALIQCS